MAKKPTLSFNNLSNMLRWLCRDNTVADPRKCNGGDVAGDPLDYGNHHNNESELVEPGKTPVDIGRIDDIAESIVAEAAIAAAETPMRTSESAYCLR